MRWWLLISVAFATCPGTPQCSGIGYCKSTGACYCGLRHGFPDCSYYLPLARKAALPVSLQWLGFTWYLSLLITTLYCIRNISKAKGLTYGLWNRIGTLFQIDPQQLPLTCCFLHCFFASLYYGIDPYFMNPSVPQALTIMLFLIDLTAFISMICFLIRFWVQLQTKFRPSNQKGKFICTLSMYDMVYGIFLALQTAGTVVYAVGVQTPPHLTRASLLTRASTTVLGVSVGCYVAYLVGFGAYYGLQMKQQLQLHTNALAGPTEATLTAIKKITRLLRVLLAVGALSLVAAVVYLSLTAGVFRFSKLYGLYSYLIVFCLVRVIFGIFLVVILRTLGQPSESRRRSGGSRGSKGSKGSKGGKPSPNSPKRAHNTSRRPEKNSSVEGPGMGLGVAAGLQKIQSDAHSIDFPTTMRTAESLPLEANDRQSQGDEQLQHQGQHQPSLPLQPQSDESGELVAAINAE